MTITFRTRSRSWPAEPFRCGASPASRGSLTAQDGCVVLNVHDGSSIPTFPPCSQAPKSRSSVLNARSCGPPLYLNRSEPNGERRGACSEAAARALQLSHGRQIEHFAAVRRMQPDVGATFRLLYGAAHLWLPRRVAVLKHHHRRARSNRSFVGFTRRLSQRSLTGAARRMRLKRESHFSAVRCYRVLGDSWKVEAFPAAVAIPFSSSLRIIGSMKRIYRDAVAPADQ